MITIIDYGIGNLGSVSNALVKLVKKFQITSDPVELKKSDLLILPGVGAAGAGMMNLKKRKLDKVLIEEIKKGKPILGICLGMQLLFDTSEEGVVNCLGILKGTVTKFRKEKKIPQIGWNQVNYQKSPPRPRLPDGQGQAGEIKSQYYKLKLKNIVSEIPNNSYFYFVNSYYCVPTDESIVIGESKYGESFASIIVKKNIVATQFHPEKSGAVGFLLLKNIINITSL